ncbi:MAG: phage tail protein [Tetragenococcus koreensis]|nr:phage tail protein [Tetragenococcus koreensis]
MYRVTIYENPESSKGIEIHSPYNNDLKVDSDTLKPSINEIGTFNFTIYPNNPGWGKIQPLTTLIKVEDVPHDFVVFEGRVLQPTTDQGDDRVLSESYLCEDEKAYLHDSIQSWKKFTGNRTGEQLFREALKVHNEQVEDYKKFEVGHIDMPDLSDNVRFMSDTDDTFDNISDKLLENENIGGELHIRKENNVRYIDWVQEVGEEKKTPIRLRKNMLDMTKELDPTEIVTKLYPRGERLEGGGDDEESQNQSKPRLTIADVNDGKEYLLADQEIINEFGIQGGMQTWDDITQANILKSTAQKWLDNQLVATGKFNITVLDLSLLNLDPDRFWIGNTHLVQNPLMNVDERLRIVDINIKINSPEESEVHFGDKELTLSQYQKSLTKERQKMRIIQDTVRMQSKSVEKIKTDLTRAQQTIVDLQETVKNGDTNVQNQITAIIDDLQVIAGMVPDEETITDIETDITVLQQNKTIQDSKNLSYEERLKNLEEAINKEE